MSTLFDRITSEDNLYTAYKQTLTGKSKYNKDAMIFTRDETYNLRKLRYQLINDTYEFDDYIKFYVYEPKERLIHAPHFKDKIVQIAMNNVLKEIYFPTFIHDSYSCIDYKGTHKCAAKIQKNLRKAKWMWDNPVILKLDIKKFFYSINRVIFKKILPVKILCNRTLNLFYKIVDSADRISKKGLPLGNTLSQLGSNIDMTPFDNFIKRKNGIKFYVRYADDMFLVLENKQHAKEMLDKSEKFLNKELDLKLNKNKSKIFPLNQGVNGIGYKIYTTHMLLRNDSKKRVKRKLKAMPKLICEGRMTPEKAQQMLNSWKGHADYANSYNFYKKLTDKFNFLELKNDKFKIKESEILAI